MLFAAISSSSRRCNLCLKSRRSPFRCIDRTCSSLTAKFRGRMRMRSSNDRDLKDRASSTNYMKNFPNSRTANLNNRSRFASYTSCMLLPTARNHSYNRNCRCDLRCPHSYCRKTARGSRPSNNSHSPARSNYCNLNTFVYRFPL